MWQPGDVTEPIAPTYYTCPHCNEALELIEVLWIHPIYATDMLRITHYCVHAGWCETRYMRNDAAMHNLFGGIGPLPYSALTGLTHSQGEAVDYIVVEPPATDDGLAQRWKFDLDGVDSAHDLLLFMRGRRSDDDATRRRYRKLWRRPSPPDASPDEPTHK